MQVLCLESGECQALAPGVRVVFEATDLSSVSPATISRCGVVSGPPHDHLDPGVCGRRLPHLAPTLHCLVQ